MKCWIDFVIPAFSHQTFWMRDKFWWVPSHTTTEPPPRQSFLACGIVRPDYSHSNSFRRTSVSASAALTSDYPALLRANVSSSSPIRSSMENGEDALAASWPILTSRS